MKEPFRIAVASGKGGTGKTTIATNLAVVLAGTGAHGVRRLRRRGAQRSSLPQTDDPDDSRGLDPRSRDRRDTQAQGGCSVWSGIRPLSGRSASDLLAFVESRDAIEAAVGLACGNALANRDEPGHLTGDILQHLEVRPDAAMDELVAAGFRCAARTNGDQHDVVVLQKQAAQGECRQP